MNNKYKLLLLSILLIITVISSICIGSSDITINSVIEVFNNKLFGINNGVSQKDISIVWYIRVPRILVGMLCGFSLAISGLIMQSLLKNPIASPYTLGISTGASVGVAIAIITGVTIPFVPMLTLPLFGFIGSVLTILFVIMLASTFDEDMSSATIIIIGMVVSLTLSGILTLIIFMAKDDARSIIYWQMGSLAQKQYKDIIVLLPVILISIFVLLIYSTELDILAFGEHQAKLLGVETNRIKIIIIIFSTLLTGVVISITGILGFIGLISAHIARKIFGNNHRILIFSSGMIGAILLIISDTFARTIASPAELPVGAITSLIGGPFFAYVYLNRKGF